MRIRFAIGAAVAGLALAVAAPVEAKLYKWVDADGNVTYSERKPPDAEAEEVRVHTRSVTSEEAREQLDVLQGRAEEQQERRDFEESHATALREREERFEKNCEIARENLRILETNARVKTTDDQGREVYLDEEQIAGRLERARGDIEKFCE